MLDFKCTLVVKSYSTAAIQSTLSFPWKLIFYIFAVVNSSSMWILFLEKIFVSKTLFLLPRYRLNQSVVLTIRKEFVKIH